MATWLEFRRVLFRSSVGILADSARCSPLTPGRLLMTATSSTGSVPERWASINAWRLLPLPEISTSTRVRGWEEALWVTVTAPAARPGPRPPEPLQYAPG